jgi:signal transduction histidine kinase
VPQKFHAVLKKKVETQHLEIRRLQDLNREIVAAIPSIVIVLDSNLNIIFANDRLKELLQVPLKPGVQLHVSAVLSISFARAQELISKIEDVKRTGFSQEMRDSVFLTGPAERRIFLNIWISRIGESGSEQILLVLEDVTETISRRDVVSMLHNIAMSIQTTLDMDRVLFTVLTCATAGVAIGFSRAFLFLINEKEQTLEGEMGVGPESLQDAIRIWSSLGSEQKTLEELIRAYDAIQDRDKMPLRQFTRSIRFSLRDLREVPVRAINDRRATVVRDAAKDERVSAFFRQKFGSDSFVCVPMVARNRPVGVVIADNMYSGRPITDDKVELLETFVSQAALAVDNAEAYLSLQDKVDRLEKAYEELQSAQEQLVRAEQMAAIGDMAARIAHEIRNPLVTIGGFARAINRAPERASRVRSNSWIVVQEVERLEKILSGIMDFAKPPTPVFEQNNINRIIEGMPLLLEDELAASGVKIVKDLDETIPLVTVDAAQIRQVLLNLIQNAVVALEGEGTVTVKTRAAGDHFEVFISDTGRGIPEEVREKIFAPFFTTRSAGTGLGLAIAKKIVEDHNGTITFESKPGEGTTFIVRLPIRQR